MDFLLEVDRQVFLLVNHLPHCSLVVSLMLFLSTIGIAGATWFILGSLFVFREKKKDLKSIISFLWPLILSLVLSHLVVNLTLKPLTSRMRPNFVLPETILLGPVHYDFSFPSGHATSSFAAAYVLGKKRKRLRLLLYLLAALISFSRVYLGVHYPSDVIVGAVLGVLIGKISIFLDKKMDRIQMSS